MKKTARGFTLVELLVVIAIIAILAAVVMLIINPLEITRRSRDATRLSDLANLQQAISIALQEGTASSQINPACNDVSVSCGPNRTSDGTGVPSGARDTDGTGWVQVNFSGQSNVIVPTLPIDPTNDGITAASYHYTYCGNGNDWKIMAKLQSTKESGRHGTDGGTDPNSYEVGSLMTLACAYGT